MLRFTNIPAINANDTEVELVVWLATPNQYVTKGVALCSVETTKSIVDIVSEWDGYLKIIAEPGKKYNVGSKICYIAKNINDEIPKNDAALQIPSEENLKEKKWTKKAYLLANKLGFDIIELASRYPNTLINESFIESLQKEKSSDLSYTKPDIDIDVDIDLSYNLNPYKRKERILILGAGGGCSLVLDILSRISDQYPVGILDNDPSKTGSVNGIPILGNFNLINSLWHENKFDKVISTIVRSVDDRADIFENISASKIPFANIIDPSVRIGEGVEIGTGNLIIYGSYIATEVSIGHNNFFAAGTYLEHHCSIGNHCTFGPRTTLSGAVVVNNKVKIGTQVSIEPQLTIGHNATIASGLVITSNIDSNSIVKSVSNLAIKSK